MDVQAIKAASGEPRRDFLASVCGVASPLLNAKTLTDIADVDNED